MIPCICIDDSNRPNEIPTSKWLKKGAKYHVVYVVTVLPQNTLAFELDEIELTENEYPYKYFASTRFAFSEKNYALLGELIENCIGAEDAISQLIKQNKNDTRITRQGQDDKVERDIHK